MKISWQKDRKEAGTESDPTRQDTHYISNIYMEICAVIADDKLKNTESLTVSSMI